MAQLAQFANNAATTLSAPVTTAGQTSISVTSAAAFPTLTGGQYFYATITDTAVPPTVLEIVKVTSVAGTALTVDRGQDGTAAQSSWAAGSKIELRLVRALMQQMVMSDDPAGPAFKTLPNVWTAQQTPMNGALVDGANIDWNGNTKGQVVTVTLAGNRTMNAPTNIKQYAMYLLRVTQDGTGSRTLSWNAAFKFGTAGAPTLTTTASKTDILSFVGGAGNTLEFIGIRKDAV